MSIRRNHYIFFVVCMFAFLFLKGECNILAINNLDFKVQDFYSFEDGVEPARVLGNHSKAKSTLKISSKHFKNGNKSLRWKWKGANPAIILDTTVPYAKVNPKNPQESSVSSFVFWVYSPKKLDAELEFLFVKDFKSDSEYRVCSSFTYNLSFSGWRGSWVAFDRDMIGCPEENMSGVIIKVKGAKKGELYFDGISTAAFEDVRYHTPDFQAPFINKDNDVHWLQLYKHWQKELDNFDRQSSKAGHKDCSQSAKDLDIIRDRYVSLITKNRKSWSFEKLLKKFESYNIYETANGGIIGKPIFFIRYAETYINLGIPDGKKQLKFRGQLLRDYNDLMYQIALAWYNLNNGKKLKYKDYTKAQLKGELEHMYVLMTRHLLDQGFAAGSGMGTLHHLGYSMRNFYTGPVIMQKVLAKAGLDQQMQQAMEWFSGVGEVKLRPKQLGMDIDAFNTYLTSRLAAIIMLPNNPYKVAYMKAFSRWVDNGYKYTGGLKATFKSDGTVFHHRRAYPAYAVGGFDGAVEAIWLLRSTPFAISKESHRNMKKALVEMEFYCNKLSFPLSMSGRHPDGKGGLIPRQYALLALSGSVPADGEKDIDVELASKYLRLIDGKKKLTKEEKDYAKIFRAKGIKKATSPQGVKAYNYNSSLSVRKDNWLVTIAGHSRYFWAAEIYRKCNMYGRYLNHGSMGIIADSIADPNSKQISLIGSGYAVNGYDWCHFPGTTAAERPLSEMKANVLNVDDCSGYEEMLLSDEWFAGGVAHKIGANNAGQAGVYSMKLHEHDKYNGSLRAKKSFFVFGNKIVCLGTDLENELPNSSLTTTLFQNTITKNSPSYVSGKPIYSMNYRDTLDKAKISLMDRFHNLYIVKDTPVVLSRSLQHSFHEETCAPTKGNFEKAFLLHWKNTDKVLKSKDTYEYLCVIKPTEEEVKNYEAKLPYTVLKADEDAHVVFDNEDQILGAAVFNESKVDELILSASPSVLMYSFMDTTNQDKVLISVSNPDFALYEGENDDLYTEDGVRIEKSIYSRKWVDNNSLDTYVTLRLSGSWSLQKPIEGVEIKTLENAEKQLCTYVKIKTREARTEEMTLVKK